MESEPPLILSRFGPNGAELDLKARAALWERQFDVTVNRLLAAGKTVVLACRLRRCHQCADG